MKTWLKITLWILALGAIVLVGVSTIPPFLRGCALRDRLLTVLDKAVTVRVVEHSHWRDRLVMNLSEVYQEKIYRTTMLDTVQRNALRAALPRTLDYSGTIHLRCIFHPHHRIEFTGPDGKITVLEICFKCGDLAIDDEKKRLMPVGWEESLEKFLNTLGMTRAPQDAPP